MDYDQGIDYLTEYGYYDEGEGSVQSAVERYQIQHGGLIVDGNLGPKTLRSMNAPRCGCTAQMLRGQGAGLAKWPDRDWLNDPLLYSFERFVRGIAPDRQRQLAKEAVDSWANVCGIMAREVKVGERPDVVISTGSGRKDNFDGPGRTLAWAYVAGSLLKFDESETWGESGNSIHWKNVFAHEWGHIIGLDHSNIESALMAPFYTESVFAPQSPDDAEEGVRRYGKPVKVPDPSDPGDPSGGGTAKMAFEFPGDVWTVTEKIGGIWRVEAK